MKHELQHLKRRARNRIGLVLLLTVGATAALVGYVARREPLHESTVVVRITEGGLLSERSPLTRGDLRQYIVDSALSSRNLLALIERFDLYPVHRLRGDRFALARLEDRLDVEVFRNYFVRGSEGRTTSRTARVAISFRDPDRERSFAVTRAVADLVIATETQRRRSYSADDLRIAEQAFHVAATALAERAAEVSELEVALAAATGPGDAARRGSFTVELATARSQLEAQRLLVDAVRGRLEEVALLHASEGAQLGLQYTIADEQAPPPRGARLPRLARLALVCFLILLPLCGVAVGAFDGTLQDAEDLDRLAVPVLGHVPPFRGHRVGGLDERRRRRRRQRGDAKL
jgi:hypothetical protein